MKEKKDDEQLSNPFNRSTSMYTEASAEPGEKSKSSLWSKCLRVILLTAATGALCCLMIFLLTAADTINVNDKRQIRRSTSIEEHSLPPWKPGLLDIHHLHVGPSEVS